MKNQYQISRKTKQLNKVIKYPFYKLKVGQSFFIPNKTQRQVSPLCAYYHKQIKESCFVTQADTVDGIKGVRVYRIDENSTFAITNN